MGDVVAAYHSCDWCRKYAFVRVTGFTPAGNLRLDLLRGVRGEQREYNYTTFQGVRPMPSDTVRRLVARRCRGEFQFKLDGDVFECVGRYDPQNTYTVESHM